MSADPNPADPAANPASPSAPDPAPAPVDGRGTNIPVAPRRAMFLAALVVAIDLLGFGIVLPLMPRLADEYMTTYPDPLKGVIIGVLYSSFSLMQLVFAPVWGRISDRIGRRPVLLISLAGSVVFYALFAVASTLPMRWGELALALMLLARVGAGIAGASVGTAAAVIADCTPPDKRGRGMALIGAAFGIGFTFGPLIAYVGLQIFEQQKWGVGAIASAVSALAFVLALARFPETRKRPAGSTNPDPASTDSPGTSPTEATRSAFSLRRTREVLAMPHVGPLVLVYFLAIFAFANFEATLALVTKSLFDFADDENFLVFAAIGGVLFVAQILYRALVGRWKEHRMLVVGVLLMLMGLAGITSVTVGASLLLSRSAALGLQPLFFGSIALAVTGFGFTNSSISSLVSQRADPARQGEVLGVNQSCAALGRILGPFVGSVLFQWHASRALPYLLAGLTLLLVLMLLPAAIRPTPAPDTPRSSDDTA